MAIEERIDVEVRALETCAFKRDVFRTTLDQVIMLCFVIILSRLTFLDLFNPFVLRVKGPHNVGDFSGRSGRSPGPLLTYLGLYICSNAPKEGFPGIRQVFFD